MFKDSKGRSWIVDLDTTAIRRVRQFVDLDLMDAAGGDVLGKLVDDPVLLCDTLFAIVKPQADAQDISDEEFGQGLGGDVLEEAATALLEALVAFFPPRRRPVAERCVTRLRQMEERAVAVAVEHLDDPALLTRMENALHGRGPSSTNAPEFAESTRDH